MSESGTLSPLSVPVGPQQQQQLVPQHQESGGVGVGAPGFCSIALSVSQSVTGQRAADDELLLLECWSSNDEFSA